MVCALHTTILWPIGDYIYFLIFSLFKLNAATGKEVIYYPWETYACLK